jgi:hypothetical protein
MELHPVLMMALLPLAQYFFGVWGLILATPVAVYVIYVIILRRGLPGMGGAHETLASGSAAGPGAGTEGQVTRAVAEKRRRTWRLLKPRKEVAGS